MKRAAILAVLVLASCSQPWPYGVEPPPDYAHREPKVPVIVLPLPLSRVNSACHEIFVDHTNRGVDGCAMLGTKACLVVIPIAAPAPGYPQAHIDAIFQHEKYGHCNDLVHGPDGRGWHLRK